MGVRPVRGPHRRGIAARDGPADTVTAVGSHSYDDVLATSRRPRRQVPQVPAETGLVVEDAAGGFCGAVVRCEPGGVVLEDRHGRHRVFPFGPAAFLVDGRPVTLVPPRPQRSSTPSRSASGSVRVDDLRARVARGSRIWVEGLHDAELVERVWGHDLRVEGVVVELLQGADNLQEVLSEFGPGRERRVSLLPVTR